MIERRSRPRRVELALTLVGVSLVVVGFYLPWVRVNPVHEGPVHDVFLPGMEWGFQGIDVAAVGVVVLLATVGLGTRRRIGTAATTAAGLVAVSVPLWHAFEVLGGLGTFLPGASPDATFVSAIGASVTVLGGLALLLATAARVVGRVSRRTRSAVVE